MQWNEVLCHRCSLLQGVLLPQTQEPAWQREDSLPLNWAEVTTLLGVSPQGLACTPRTDQSSSFIISISHLSHGHPLEVAADRASLLAWGSVRDQRGIQKPLCNSSISPGFASGFLVFDTHLKKKRNLFLILLARRR